MVVGAVLLALLSRHSLVWEGQALPVLQSLARQADRAVPRVGSFHHRDKRRSVGEARQTRPCDLPSSTEVLLHEF